MVDFNSHSEVITETESTKGADKDLRDNYREVDIFCNKEGGQWEDKYAQVMDEGGLPRMTYDQITPVLLNIENALRNSAFTNKVEPVNLDGDDKIAKTISGLLRAIEQQSNAEDIYLSVGSDASMGGFSAFRLVIEELSPDSFDQDILIKDVFNAIDSLWFDQYAQKRTKEDAKWALFQSPISRAKFEKRWPDITPQSLSEESGSSYTDKPADIITIGEFWYKKPYTRELALMSDGSVYEVNDDYKKVKKELKQRGITEVKTRKRQAFKVMQRLICGSDWLSEERETSFKLLPFVPCYLRYKISEGKPIWKGKVAALMDPARIVNYAVSREISNHALAPVEKIVMTAEQASGNDYGDMNASIDPILEYNHIANQPPPFKIGGPAPDSALQAIAAQASAAIDEASGRYDANKGNAAGMISGVAVDKLQARGDNSTAESLDALKIAIQHSCKIAVGAMPAVYDSKRVVRLLNEDGSSELVTLHDVVPDEETGENVELNDLSQGQYDTTCTVGPAYSSRQDEAVAALKEIGAIMPDVLQRSADIYLNQINAPGMDQVSERQRKWAIDNGFVLWDQMSKEEQAQQQAKAQQTQQPDAMTIAALAEQQKAQNEADRLQVDTQEKGLKLQQHDRELTIKERELDLKDAEASVNAEIKKGEFVNKMEMQQFTQQMQEARLFMDQQTNVINNLKTEIEGLKTLKEATGADGVVTPLTSETYLNQQENIVDSQDEIN